MVAIAVPPDAIQPVRMFMARRAAAAKPIYRAWRSARSKLATSMAQLDELRRASRCPKLRTILPAHRVDAMVDDMQRAILFGALPMFAQDVGANDPNDAFLLAMALAGEAGYIVTSDRSARLPQRDDIGRKPIATRPPFAPTRFDAIPSERCNGGRPTCALRLMTVRFVGTCSRTTGRCARHGVVSALVAVRSRWRFGVP